VTKLLPLFLRKLSSAGVRLRRSIVSQRFGFSPSLVYGDEFFESEACSMTGRRADAIARAIHERWAPKSVFDFGCGRGWLLSALHALGVDAVGCEGSLSGVERCAPDILVTHADLRRPVVMNRTFDLVMCVEVAEHLPGSAAETLVTSIARAASSRILFSASGPGQDGDDHIHLRPPAYWAGKFAAHGFLENSGETTHMRREMDRIGAPHWYQNLIILERK